MGSDLCLAAGRQAALPAAFGAPPSRGCQLRGGHRRRTVLLQVFAPFPVLIWFVKLMAMM